MGEQETSMGDRGFGRGVGARVEGGGRGKQGNTVGVGVGEQAASIGRQGRRAGATVEGKEAKEQGPAWGHWE